MEYLISMTRIGIVKDMMQVVIKKQIVKWIESALIGTMSENEEINRIIMETIEDANAYG
jgi:hypothetical protein